MNWDTIETLAHDVEAKDSCTAAHTVRVALYAQAVAEDADWSEDRVKRLMQAAVVHDIGKIDVPQHILIKPGPLTPEEYRIMQLHTVHGHERLLSMGVDDPIMLDLVRWHHERLDGTGYPDGLAGEQIPLAARAFAVIDCFDALTSIRPYRADIGVDAAERAIAELRRHCGTWYWPEAVGRFERLYRTGALDWILHHLNDVSVLTNQAARADLLVLGRGDRLPASMRSPGGSSASDHGSASCPDRAARP